MERNPASGGRLDELYRRHYTEMLRLAYLISGDRAQAEDLVQESFIRASGRFIELRNPDAFGAYLKRTLINLCRKQFRRGRVERAYLEREARQPRTASVEPDIATQEAMRVALSRLSQRQRAAIVLRFYGDLSEREIAEALACRPGTVKSVDLPGHGSASVRDRDGSGRMTSLSDLVRETLHSIAEDVEPEEPIRIPSQTARRIRLRRTRTVGISW